MFCAAVEIGRRGSGGDFVGSLAGCAREDVVSGDVDEVDGVRGAESGEVRGGGYIEGGCATGVGLAFVGVAVRCACIPYSSTHLLSQLFVNRRWHVQ